MLGTGTLQNPYIITTPDEYRNIISSNTNANHYVLGNDIDFSGYDVSTFNATRNLSGSLDGKGFTVKNATGVSVANIAMIPNLQAGAVLKNIRYENINLSTTSVTANRTCALLGTVTSATIDNLEVVNSSFNAGKTAQIASVIKQLSGSFNIKNIRMIDVSIKGGAGNTGFFGTVNTVIGGYSFSDGVFTGSFSDYAIDAKSDALFGHEADSSLFFYKVYVLDENLPQFDRSKGCATYVTDAQLNDPSQIPLGDAWSHSTGKYPVLIKFSEEAGKEVTVKKTVTARKATTKGFIGKSKTQSKSITAKGAIAYTDSLHYSTRTLVTARGATVTVTTKKTNSYRVVSSFDVKKATTSFELLKRSLRYATINSNYVDFYSRVIYPSSGNVPVYAYTSIITTHSNIECRVTQSSIYRIL
ncbi:hypothetical protein [Lysinibacillus capsici]|uniref:hypothetical protein n=1 Tax=Lysinibacillus capsici TaxID=2115968 RepID=UPI003081DD4C|nr:hypothetical protein ICJ70_13300 [Lysinibacillus capsici]